MESVSPEGISRGIRVVERRVEWTRLVAMEEGLLAFGVFILLFVAISVLADLTRQRDAVSIERNRAPEVYYCPLTSRATVCEYRLLSLTGGE